MSPKIDAPYLWIRPLGLVPLNLAYRLLQIIMDHLYIPVITLHLSIVAKKHSITTITQLRSLELLIKTPLLHILYYINGLTHDFGLEQEGGSLIAPMALLHPLHPIDNRSRNKRRNLWVGRCVSSRWPWFPSRSSVLIYVYMYVHSLYEFCYRSYIQRECHPVLAKLHPITFYRIVFLGSARLLSWMPLFVFFGLPIVSCSLIKV